MRALAGTVGALALVGGALVGMAGCSPGTAKHAPTSVSSGTTTTTAPVAAKRPLAGWARATSASEFASEVLAGAPLPPGAHLWKGKIPGALQTAGERPSGALIDLHRLYSSTWPAGQRLQTYVLAHLPQGAGSAGTSYYSPGNGSAGSEGLAVTLPTYGPNEYSAQLLYATVSTAAGAYVLRVDAQTTWAQTRAASEKVPGNYRALLTGFKALSLMRGPSGPASVDLSPADSARLVKAFDALPLGGGGMCMEDSLLYTITFSPTSGAGPGYKVSGWGCAASVQVSTGNSVLPPLYDKSCSLLDLVRQFAPASATATRELTCP